MLKSIWIENHGEARSGGPLLAYLGESGEVLSNLGLAVLVGLTELESVTSTVSR